MLRRQNTGDRRQETRMQKEGGRRQETGVRNLEIEFRIQRSA
jgi:hypothetical protein